MIDVQYDPEPSLWERQMSDSSPTSDSVVLSVSRKAVFAPGVFPGVYSNEIQQFQTMNETVVDFQLISPSSYEYDQALQMSNPDIGRTIVARVIVPNPVFERFVAAYIVNHPDFLGQIPAILAPRES